MPSVAAGNLIIDGWTVLKDLDQTPLTGMTVPASVTLALDRMAGTARIAASESITWAELGTTGRYYFFFTPTNSGLYILTLNEVEPLSMQRKGVEFRWDVVSAGAVFAPSYANAFCGEADIERWINASIDNTKSPNDTEAAAFAEGRAARLTSITAKTGSAVTPSTVIAGSRMEDLLRKANAIGAAIDYLTAQTRALAPFDAGRGRISKLQDLWDSLAGYYIGTTFVPGWIQDEISSNVISLSTNHILSGDTLPRDNSSPPTDVGSQIGMGDRF